MLGGEIFVRLVKTKFKLVLSNHTVNIRLGFTAHRRQDFCDCTICPGLVIRSLM